MEGINTASGIMGSWKPWWIPWEKERRQQGAKFFPPSHLESLLSTVRRPASKSDLPAFLGSGASSQAPSKYDPRGIGTLVKDIWNSRPWAVLALCGYECYSSFHLPTSDHLFMNTSEGSTDVLRGSCRELSSSLDHIPQQETHISMHIHVQGPHMQAHTHTCVTETKAF